MAKVTIEDIERAAKLIAPVARRTPMVASQALSEATGGEVHLKLENLQRTGSFKFRGAFVRLSALSQAERARGVVAASAGNHAQGVALAARLLGAPATIFMPEGAPLSKVTATKAHGATVVLEGRDYNEAHAAARGHEQRSGSVFIHPFDDPAVIAGQGTIGLEILDAVHDVDVVLVGVGGGGLCAGIGTAIKALRPSCRVVGVEPAGADAMHRSLAAGRRVALERVDTIADGLATREAGELTFELFRSVADEVVVVPDDAIANAMLFLLENEKTVAEGAGAAAVAALLDGAVDVRGKKAVAVVSGGNIDVTLLEHIIDRGLVRSGRVFKFTTVLRDRPGALRDLLDVIARQKANVVRVEHDRRRADVSVRAAVVHLELETRGPDHVAQIVGALGDAGYDVDTGP